MAKSTEYSLDKGDFFIPFYILQDTELYLTERVIMALVHNNSPCTLTNAEIGGDVGISPTQVSRIVNDLEKKGRIKISYIQENYTSNTRTRVLTINEDKVIFVEK